MDSVSGQVATYQTQCKKMPKALRDWDAYKELKDTIDNFLEVLPLLQSLAQKSIMPRHWTQVMEVCGKEINLDPEVMKLKDLLGMGMLEHAEVRRHPLTQHIHLHMCVHTARSRSMGWACWRTQTY